MPNNVFFIEKSNKFKKRITKYKIIILKNIYDFEIKNLRSILKNVLGGSLL